MRPDDLQYGMLKIAKAAHESSGEMVFVMREVLTSAYRQGFEDGHLAATRDDFAEKQIDRLKADAAESARPEEQTNADS